MEINRLTSIRRAQLAYLSALSEINFAGNEISMIDSDAFIDLPASVTMFVLSTFSAGHCIELQMILLSERACSDADNCNLLSRT